MGNDRLTGREGFSKPPILKGHKVGNIPGNRSGFLYSFIAVDPRCRIRSGRVLLPISLTKLRRPALTKVRPLSLSPSGSETPTFSRNTNGSSDLEWESFNNSAGCSLGPAVSSKKIQEASDMWS